MKIMGYTVVFGDLSTGFKCFGLFETFDEAADWCTMEPDAWVMAVYAPDSYKGPVPAWQGV